MKFFFLTIALFVSYLAYAQYFNLGYSFQPNYRPILHGLGNYMESDTMVCFDYEVGTIMHTVCNYKLNGAPALCETWVFSLDKQRIYAHGPYMVFYPNGSPIMMSNYVYGCLFGTYAEWHENGEQRIIGEYWLDINDTVAYLNNFIFDTTIVIDPISFRENLEIVCREALQLKHGLWQYFDSTGALINKEMWDKGVLIE